MREPDSAQPEGRRGRLRTAALVVLLVATAAAHSSSLDGGFVFDDLRFIPDNHAIRDLSSLPRFFTDASTMTATMGLPGWNDIYRPLRTLSFAIDWALFGDRAVGYRIESLLWHLTAVLLAWFLLRRLLGNPWLATLGAGLFALHPVQVQTVSWISSRGDLMAAVFLLGAALLLLRPRPRPVSTGGGVALYALALLSKESAIALLALVPLYDLLLAAPRPRFRGRLCAALAATTVLFLVARFHVAEGQLPFRAEGLLAAGSALVVSVGSLVFPMGLAPFTGDLLYERLTVGMGGVVLALAAVLVAVAIVRGRRAPRAAFGLLWAAACLAPVSGLVPLKSLAECRFSYLPALGFGMLLALVVRRMGRTGIALSVVVLVLLGAWTFKESKMWASERPLWETAVTRASRVFGGAREAALSNLGNARSKDGDHEAAIEAYRRSLAHLETPMVRAKLALEYSAVGDPEKSLEAARAAVRLDPGCVPARDILGEVLLRVRRYEEAVAQLRIAVEMAPELVHPRKRLGRALLGGGRNVEAVTQLREAVRSAPRDPEGHVLLGEALHAAGADEEALVEFDVAVALDGASARPHLSAGRLLLDAGRPKEALRAFNRAFGLEPENAAVRAERAAAVAAIGGTVDSGVIADLLTAVRQLVDLRDLTSLLAVLDRPGVRRLGHPELETHLVWALIEGGDLRRARAELIVAMRARPDDIRPRANLGLVELQLDRPERAIPHLEAAVAVDTDSFLLAISLARAYRGVGRADDATRLAGRAARVAKSEDQRLEAQVFLAGGE